MPDENKEGGTNNQSETEGRMPMKAYNILEQVVFEAYEQVKKNKGAAGVDSQTLGEFEKNLEDNLYKIWNRMSSGTYFPPPVRTVAIPKSKGGERLLGIPTVADRIAQAVVKIYLEPTVEPHFHPDSYGYRLGKSAIEAIRTARERCWDYDWVIDLDIKGFFDNLDHDLVMRFVGRYTDSKWILLYVKRWLKAPSQSADGTLVDRTKGTPQGGVISPLLANIFMHEAFDSWMEKEFPSTPFERYADDAIVHCKTEKQAWFVRDSIRERLAEYKLELHPEKTRIVYCRDSNRNENYPEEKFDFLGYTFRARQAKNKLGKLFTSFSPAISNKARKAISLKIRGWRVHHHSDIELADIAKAVNPILRGWINYYCKFYKSALYPVFNRFNYTLIRWVKTKYKKLHGYRKARKWLGQKAKEQPNLFAHWQMLGIKPSVV